MEDKAIIGIIEATLREKINKNADYIRYTFYELRVKYNLSEEDIDRFLYLIRTKLQNESYRVYFTGTRFKYDNQMRIVEPNEYMIAIKTKVI